MRTGKKNNIHKTYQSEWNAFRQFENMNALSVIYEENFDLLLNYGRKFCQEEVLIEDSIQNIFTNLIRGRERLGEINHIPHYLMTAHRNELFELISKSRKTVSSEQLPDILFKPEYSIEEVIVEQEDQTRLKKFLNSSLLKLTPHQQEILYLKYDVGLSFEAISNILNISIESCRTAVFRAVKTLKTEMEGLNIKNIQFLFMTTRKTFRR